MLRSEWPRPSFKNVSKVFEGIKIVVKISATSTEHWIMRKQASKMLNCNSSVSSHNVTTLIVVALLLCVREALSMSNEFSCNATSLTVQESFLIEMNN